MNNKNFEQFIKQKGKISCEELDKFFAGLEPVGMDEMMGEWRGKCFKTGHSKLEFLLEHLLVLKWHGKKFVNENVVKALVFSFFGIKFNLPLGTARLRKIEYGGKMSTAMVYNYFPIIDNFRKVDGKTVMGIMDIKGNAGVYFYLLKA